MFYWKIRFQRLIFLYFEVSKILHKVSMDFRGGRKSSVAHMLPFHALSLQQELIFNIVSCFQVTVSITCRPINVLRRIDLQKNPNRPFQLIQNTDSLIQMTMTKALRLDRAKDKEKTKQTHHSRRP
jgi:hypothetical protein